MRDQIVNRPSLITVSTFKDPRTEEKEKQQLKVPTLKLSYMSGIYEGSSVQTDGFSEDQNLRSEIKEICTKVPSAFTSVGQKYPTQRNALPVNVLNITSNIDFKSLNVATMET